MTGQDGLRDELIAAFRASDLAGGGIDYPTLSAAVLPVVQARIDAAREQVAEQIAQAIEALPTYNGGYAISSEYRLGHQRAQNHAADIARQHAKGDSDG